MPNGPSSACCEMKVAAQRRAFSKRTAITSDDALHSTSTALQQAVDVECRASSEVIAVRFEKALRCAATFISQHAEEGPFGIQLGRRTEPDQQIASYDVDAHSRPVIDLPVVRRSELAQERHHAQFLEQHGVERHFVQTV